MEFIQMHPARQGGDDFACRIRRLKVGTRPFRAAALIAISQAMSL
jgi:hypothetical protein